MNNLGSAKVADIMRLILLLILALGFSASAFAQEAPEGDDVRSADEIPRDMPAPPEEAPPAEAPAVGGTDERPPHPETPEDLEEQQPSAETLAKTAYHWLPGHWTWTGEQFEWKSGEWVYKVKDVILVPPRWEWDGKQWVFHNAGWAKPGTNKIVYRATPAPGGPDATANAEQVPAASTEIVQPQASTTTVYVWTGAYVAPLILFPIWHPHYHYHWYRGHAHYGRAPAYRSRRYHYSTTHRSAHYRHQSRPPSSARPPHQGGGSRPGTKPAQRPSTRPSTQPAQRPSTRPSTQPSQRPSTTPSTKPSQRPSTRPSTQPSQRPSTRPSTQPSQRPSTRPSTQPSSRRGSSTGSNRSGSSNRSGTSGRSRSGGGRRGGGGGRR